MAGGGGQSLEETPTWAVAVVCFVLVVISIFIEELIHLVGRWLKKHKKEELFEALEKIKAELMLLGFISLLLTVGQSLILQICVPQSVGKSWHPCGPQKRKENSGKLLASVGRRLVEKDGYGPSRRVLAGYGEDKCAEKGKVPLISTSGIHQLHIFIFVLALFHVLYCITTMALGRLKMRRWKSWEKETKTVEYQYSHDPERFRFTRETSFGRRHLNFWTRSPILIWIAPKQYRHVCFFRQFVRSVPKVDYLTLRHGFIMAHLSPQSLAHFDFQQYIKKSLENDFKVVVGISPLIWFFAVIFLLFNTHGWYSYFWLPFIPLIIVLAVGTKLQVVITRMALEITERGDIIKGVPVVHPADKHFWFNRPQLMLNLIHFVLFLNAFQVAFFAWSWYEFGFHSCFHEKDVDIIIRLTMGISVQILCSYVTLPLYALVTQMGTNMKPVIFNQRVANALRHWHHTARKHVKQNRKSGSVTTSPVTSRPQTPPHTLSPANGLSPLHLLQHYQRDVDMDIDSYQASPNNNHRNADGFLDRSGFNSESSSKHHANARTEGETVVEMQGIGDLPPQYGLPNRPVTEYQDEENKHVAVNFSFDKRYQRR